MKKMIHSHAFAKNLNKFNNFAKKYSNVDRIRSIMKNAMINRMNVREISKKQTNLNVLIQNLTQILNEKYDNVIFLRRIFCYN